MKEASWTADSYSAGTGIDLGGVGTILTESSMNCDRFEEKLSDYFDGLLAADEGGLFRAHALQCRSCRSLMDEVKATLQACKRQDELETPGPLETVLMAISAEPGAFDCIGFEELITEFLDGFVPAPTYHRFEEHAEACGECSTLLTGVVYAVAACHSVHTFEEVDVPESLIAGVIAMMPEGRPSLARRATDRFAAFAEHLIPRATQTARWTFATSAALALATFAFLLFGFSDDGTFAGVYRQAHVKASELYTHSTDVYVETDKVVARLERVGFGIGEFWDTLGGETTSNARDNELQQQERNPNKRAQPSEKN
jgi:anti-sigma factor RsiW